MSFQDSLFLKPGRIGVKVRVELPDTQEELVHIVPK